MVRSSQRRGRKARQDPLEGPGKDLQPIAEGHVPKGYRPVKPKAQRWAVGVSKFTLSFSNESLEAEWSRLVEPRQRALWLRSLLSSVLYQALRHAADLVEFNQRPNRATVFCRLVLCFMELSLYAVARVELVKPRQVWISSNAFLYGAVELWLVACRQWPRMTPSCWLSLSYGVAWFVVPKMSALSFFPACCGTILIVFWWLFLSFATTVTGAHLLDALVFGVFRWWSRTTTEEPTPVAAAFTQAARHLCRQSDKDFDRCTAEVVRALERTTSETTSDGGLAARAFFLASSGTASTSWLDITTGLALAVPVIVLFNVVAYSSEKSVKERFVLRSALSHEHNHDVRLALLSSGGPKKNLTVLFESFKEALFSHEVNKRRFAQAPQQRTRRQKPSDVVDDDESDASSECDTASVESAVDPPLSAAAERRTPPPPPPPTQQQQQFPTGGRKLKNRAAVAAVPCACLAALGWFPSAQRFTSQLVMESLGGADAAWAALTHVAGLTLFLLVVTRRVRFVFLTPLVCICLFWLLAQLWNKNQNDLVTTFCDANCGVLSKNGSLFGLDVYAEPCTACQDDSMVETSGFFTMTAKSPEDSLATAQRYIGSVVLGACFLYALGLFAKMVRLFARLLVFARRTLFLYPHLAEYLWGGYKGDSETLMKLVSPDHLPKLPAGPAAVKDAVLPKAPQELDHHDHRNDDDHQTVLDRWQQKFESEDDNVENPRALPTLAIGAHDDHCSFCPRENPKRATHAIPVCADWARWYLARAEVADQANRLRSEDGSGDVDVPADRPCCDFASLALERAALLRENNALKRRLQELTSGGVEHPHPHPHLPNDKPLLKKHPDLSTPCT